MKHRILLLKSELQAHAARALEAIFAKNSTAAAGVLPASAVTSPTEVAC